MTDEQRLIVFTRPQTINPVGDCWGLACRAPIKPSFNWVGMFA